MHAPHHHPPHIFQNNTIYFISARTIGEKPYFNSTQKKDIFLQVFQRAIQKFSIDLYAWVLLDNHYHLLFRIKHGKNLSKFIQNLHTNSARLLNVNNGVSNRKIWYQYWDHCIRNEQDFWRHFNYIHHNPVKHRYIESQSKCLNYRFSSYKNWLQKESEEWLNTCFLQYPIIDFTVEGD